MPSSRSYLHEFILTYHSLTLPDSISTRMDQYFHICLQRHRHWPIQGKNKKRKNWLSNFWSCTNTDRFLWKKTLPGVLWRVSGAVWMSLWLLRQQHPAFLKDCRDPLVLLHTLHTPPTAVQVIILLLCVHHSALSHFPLFRHQFQLSRMGLAGRMTL